MVIVYALYDRESRQIYVGMTNNLERRLREHRRGQSFFTRMFKDITVIYTENREDYGSGRRREKYLKSGIGREFLRTLIQ